MKLSHLCIIALLSMPLFADKNENNPLYDSAQKAYALGSFKTAYPLFEQLLETMPESAEINFFVGRCALELRQYDEAIAAFDRVLILNPNHTRTHLELARLYYERANYELAQHELDTVLKENIPQEIKDVSLALKSKINREISPHTFNGALMIGGGYDSNVNNDIGTKIFTLPSLNIPLLGNTKEKDAYAFSTFLLTHTYDFGERGGWSLVDSLIAYDKLYTQSSQNNLALFALSSAPTWSEKNLKIALPITFDRVYIDGRGYLYNVGMGVKTTYLINSYSTIEGAYSFKRGFYNDETHDLNAHLFSLMYHRILGENFLSLGLHTSYGINQEIESTRTDVQNSEFKYGITLSKELTKALRTSVGYSRIETNYDDVDTNFLTKRKDNKDQYELSLDYALQKNLSIGTTLLYSNNGSNHPPYDYSKLNLLANIMWTF